MTAIGHRPTNAGLAIVVEAGRAAAEAEGPEAAIRGIVGTCFRALGDRRAHQRAGALEEGQKQFFVAGGFFVTPDRRHQVLVGNIGFPPEQERLTIPIDGGHPGRVIATARSLLLRDTREHPEFTQYLKTSRMGSAVYAPLIWRGETFGLLIVAAQAYGTFGEEDLEVLSACAGLAAAAWWAHGGPQWLANICAGLSMVSRS